MLRITIPLIWYALRIELLRPSRVIARRPERVDRLSPYLRRDIGLDL